MTFRNQVWVEQDGQRRVADDSRFNRCWLDINGHPHPDENSAVGKAGPGHDVVNRHSCTYPDAPLGRTNCYTYHGRFGGFGKADEHAFNLWTAAVVFASLAALACIFGWCVDLCCSETNKMVSSAVVERSESETNPSSIEAV